MAPALIRSAKTGSGAAGSLTGLTSPAAGNLLVMGMAQSVSVGEPVPKDNLGTTGWTLILIHAVNSANANSTWIAYKVAVGTETELIPTVGSGGTMQGIWYEEWSGLAAELDGEAVHTDNQGSGKAVTSPGVTTTNANSVVFAAVGVTAAAFGKVSAWVPSGVTTITPEVSSRIIGASHAPGSILTAQTYKAEWEVGKTSSILVVAFKPSGGTPTTITLAAAAGESATSAAVTAKTQVPLAAAVGDSATSAALKAQTTVPLAAAVGESAAAALLTARTTVTLAAAVATSSTANLPLEVPSGRLIPLAPAVAESSSVTLGLRAATSIPLAAASSTSSASLTVTVPGLAEPTAAFGGALGGHSAGGARELLGATGGGAPILHGMGGAR